jgi:hypothetical protein
MAAVKQLQSKGMEMEDPDLIRARVSRKHYEFTRRHIKTIPEQVASLERRPPPMPSEGTEDSYLVSQISASSRAAESYRSNAVPSPETWYGTWGSTVYEIRFTPEPGSDAKVTTNARIIGYHGASTQMKLGIDDTINRYIFIDEKGECEHAFCPHLDASLVTGAKQVFLINERGDQVTMIRRSES